MLEKLMAFAFILVLALLPLVNAGACGDQCTGPECECTPRPQEPSPLRSICRALFISDDICSNLYDYVVMGAEG